MEHRAAPPDDVIVQVNAAAVAAVDERISTGQITEEDVGIVDDGKQIGGGGGRTRRTFSQSYKMRHRNPLEFTGWQLALLGYQSLGVVYGDIGTSPLYTFSSFTLPDPGADDVLGILSLILWTLTLVSLVKYVFIVLHADDHGEGGTFALYSLLRQHVNFSGNSMPVPVTRLASDANLKFHSKKRRLQPRMLKFLEGSPIAQAVITYLVLVGTCMVMGDGALTPSISVLSAVQGIQSRSSSIKQGHVVLLCVIILVILFLFQQYGTSKVGFTFSPIMLVWFALIASIGLYNIVKYYPPVLKAISPHYIYLFFARNKRAGWEQFGTVVLCITGAEAMFADLGHFNKKSIQMAYSCLVYPALILAYAGQAAFLIKNPSKLSTTFYSSVPEPLFWPMFIVATLAAIVASQALISASFSIIKQSIALGCFPRVSMKHTSKKYEGRVYSPEINYFLMIACILITVGFKGGPEIGQAYGVAVIWVMLITTHLITVVMVIIWQSHSAIAGLFYVIYTAIEGLMTISLLYKIAQGGWVPFAITAFFLIITLSWTYGRSKKNEYEVSNLMDREEFIKTVNMSNRVPGICIFCTDLMNGIPPIVRHYVQHMGCLRELMVFVTVRHLPVTSVLPEERFLFDRLEPFGVYRCIVQYGYMDTQNMEDDEYVLSIIASLKEIAQSDDETMMMDSALANGTTFVLGRVILKMSSKQNCFKRFVINNLYRFLQKNFRSNISSLKIAPSKTLQIGMQYEI
ncbi:potassium transporter 26-like [Miscanthus floridulus]|uniref:potassium transporter 26-like n=1 Tax=Miscanthus floridulus TaxID=154761 RepID=UPI0034596689